MYEKGIATEKSLAEAIKWYEKSAKKTIEKAYNGDSKSMRNAAFLYSRGYGVNVDLEQARKLFRESHSNEIESSEIESTYTPLMLATMKNDIETVEFLIQLGFDVNEKDGDGNTALHAATGYNRCEIAELLLKNGADKDARGYKDRKPILNAIEEGYSEIIQLFKRY